MKMVANGVWRDEWNTEPLKYTVTYTTKDVAAKKKMNHRLMATDAIDVVMMKNSPTKKTVFGWKSVTEELPNKYQNL